MIRELLNPGQNANNLAKIGKTASGCCPGTAETECTYTVLIPTANAVNNIIFKDVNGNNKTVTFSPAVTGQAAVVKAISDALKANGFDDDGKGIPGIQARTLAANTEYSINGEVVVVSMLHNTSTTVNAGTARCVKRGLCCVAVSTFTGGASTAFTINGVSSPLTSITPGTTTAAQVVSKIDAALTAGLGANKYGSIGVTDNTTSYDLVFYVPVNTVLVLGGVTLTLDRCGEAYTVA